MLTIYHNNRCSKSREVLALLEQLGRPFQVINYLNEPLDEGALRQLLKKLALTPQQLMRSKEDEYQQLGLDQTGLSDDDLPASDAAISKTDGKTCGGAW